MSAICLANPVTTQFPEVNLNIDCATELTPSELDEIVSYTIQKINNYPKSFGKTVENYFCLLFPDEVKGYLIRRAINKKSVGGIDAKTHNCREADVSGKKES